MPKKGQTLWTKARREADPEGWAQEQASRRAAKNAYYAKNKDKEKAWQAEYRAKNKDKVKSRQAEYYAKNRDREIARSAEYRETMDGKISRLVASSRKSHTKRFMQPKETFALNKERLLALWEKQGGCDSYTGVPLVPESNQPGTVSIDRIDNSIGYVEGNVALTTEGFNYFRNNQTVEEALRDLAVHVEYFIPKQGPRNAAALILKAVSHFKPADRAACLRDINAAEVLPLFSPKKEPA